MVAAGAQRSSLQLRAYSSDLMRRRAWYCFLQYNSDLRREPMHSISVLREPAQYTAVGTFAFDTVLPVSRGGKRLTSPLPSIGQTPAFHGAASYQAEWQNDSVRRAGTAKTKDARHGSAPERPTSRFTRSVVAIYQRVTTKIPVRTSTTRRGVVYPNQFACTSTVCAPLLKPSNPAPSPPSPLQHSVCTAYRAFGIAIGHWMLMLHDTHRHDTTRDA